MPFGTLGVLLFLLLALSANASTDETKPNYNPNAQSLARFAIQTNGDELTIAKSDENGPVKDDNLELDQILEGQIDGFTVSLASAQVGFGDVISDQIANGQFGKNVDPNTQVTPSDLATIGKFDNSYIKSLFAVVKDGDQVDLRQINWIERFQAAGEKTGLVKDGKLTTVDTNELLAAIADDRVLEFETDKMMTLPSGADLTTFTDGQKTYVAFQVGQDYTVVMDDGTLEQYEVLDSQAKIMASLDENNRRTSGFTKIISNFGDGGEAQIQTGLPLNQVLKKKAA